MKTIVNPPDRLSDTSQPDVTWRRDFVELTGRVLLAVIFLISGISKIGAYSQTFAYMASAGVPGQLLPVVIARSFGIDRDCHRLPDAASRLPPVGLHPVGWFDFQSQLGRSKRRYSPAQERGHR